MRWLIMILPMFMFQRLVLSLAMYPRHFRSWNCRHRKRDCRFLSVRLRLAKERAGLVDNLTESLPKVSMNKHRSNRSLKVMLPNVEAVDLDNLTDYILETCPDVLSVSAELVKEKVNKQRPEQLHQSNPTLASQENSELFRAWETQVQGTGAWLVALVRLQVLPSFQISNLEQLLHSACPALPFTITEPERRAEDGAEKDWILKVQQSWPPQHIGNLTVYFPWHNRSNCANQEEKVNFKLLVKLWLK